MSVEWLGFISASAFLLAAFFAGSETAIIAADKIRLIGRTIQPVSARTRQSIARALHRMLDATVVPTMGVAEAGDIGS